MEGMTFSQSPACGRAVERAKALERVSGAVSRSWLNDTSSIKWERGALTVGDVNLLEGNPVWSSCCIS